MAAELPVLQQFSRLLVQDWKGCQEVRCQRVAGAGSLLHWLGGDSGSRVRRWRLRTGRMSVVRHWLSVRQKEGFLHP